MLNQYLLFIFGILVLYIGGELFIRGSASVSFLLGVRPLIAGLVIAAFATSSPEFIVSLLAVIKGSNDLAIGNIIGSCTANIALVLGISALCRPIEIRASILRREFPILLAAVLAFVVISLDSMISRAESLILIISFILFIYYCIRTAKDNESSRKASDAGKRYTTIKTLIFLAIGLIGLLAGAHFIVETSKEIARSFGISELLIALSVVAIGTSLPELATSAVASLRNEGDISVGNVIGSNIFNLLAIVGVISFIRPVFVGRGALTFSLPFLLFLTVALAPILKTGFKISRREGALLLASYFIYLYIIFKR